MGIDSRLLPHDLKVKLNLAAPEKPQRTPRGKGKVGLRKAERCAAANIAFIPRTFTTLITLRTQREKTNENRYAKGRRVKQQRATVAMYLAIQRQFLPALPVTVTLVRIGPKAMDVGDNLNVSLSAVRDAVAKFYDVDDADPRITFLYDQEPGSKDYAVRICIRSAAPVSAAERAGGEVTR